MTAVSHRACADSVTLRLSAASRAQHAPAKPKSYFFRWNATVTALTREASHASLAPIAFRGRQIRMPTFGRTAIVLANLVVLLVFCFYKLHPKDRWQFEDIGYRTGFVSVAQLPLIFLLAGKNNIIGWLTGMSHERLNWLHRWTARSLLLTSTIHFGYFLADWWPYGDFASRKLRTDPITRRGLIAWAFLAWIVISSMTPIRGWNYEFFVLQHLVSFAVFIGFVYIHCPAEVRVYVWLPVGIFFFDRLVRTLYLLYTNLAIFHPKQRKQGQMGGLWACRAEFTPLLHDTTRITIANPPISWRPGQHVFLSCHSIVPLQSHPFTVASIPEDGKMEFLVKAERGGTRRFFKHAEKLGGLPTSVTDVAVCEKRSVAIEGPYGRIRPLRQFDSVIFFAGSTGATFTMPLMRDIAAAWRRAIDPPKEKGGLFNTTSGAVTRHIRFVWVVKSRGQLGWFSSQLSAAVEDVKLLRAQGHDVEIDISMYCTCDPSFTEEHKSALTSVPAPSQSPTHGPIKEAEDHESAMDEKPFKQEKFEVREVDSRAESRLNSSAKHGCQPDGTCCCKATIEDEDAISSAQCCCCGPSAVSGTRTSSACSAASSGSSTPTEKKTLLHPSIALFSGRPQPRNIIRKSLEQALGESAVVVCGPKGLVDDVRSSTVALSDERAVHKGTGAQGIYLHTEAYSY